MVVRLPLRYIQIGINSLTIVLGIIACIPQGTVTAFFESQCVLNARLSLTRVNNTIKIKATDTVWGDMETCNFTTFTAVFGAIHAFIWCWFFLLMRGSLKADGKELTILLPTLVLHFAMFVVVFVASIMLTEGAVSFCSNIESALHPKLTCSHAQEMDWSISGKKHNFYTNLIVAKISLWLMLLTILLQCLAAAFGIFKEVKPRSEESDSRTSLTKSQTSRSSSYTPALQDDVSGSMVFRSTPETESKRKKGKSEKQSKKKKPKKPEPEPGLEEPDVFVENNRPKDKLVDV